MNDTQFRNAVKTLKILSSPSRFRIIKLLLGAKRDFCVNEISKAVGLSHSATSHQLTRLEDKEIVQSFRKGQTICYVINNSPLTGKIKRVINQFT